MYLPIANTITVLVLGLGGISTTEAVKCRCEGGRLSRNACDEVGGVYEYSCGFLGCCLNEQQQNKFVEICKTLGYGFKRCDDCATCQT